MGVGGIHSAQDALDKIKLGATAVQIYTAVIYEGPGLVRKIINATVVWNKRIMGSVGLSIKK